MWRQYARENVAQSLIAVEMVTLERPTEMILETTAPGMLGTTNLDLIALSRTRTRIKVELEVKPLNLTARLLVQSLKLAKNSLTKKYKSRVADYAKQIEDRHAKSNSGGMA